MAGALTSGPMSPGLRKVVERAKRKPEGILEADIVSFFDSLDRNELKRMLQIRGAAAWTTPAGSSSRSRRVPAPTAPTGGRPARIAHQGV